MRYRGYINIMKKIYRLITCIICISFILSGCFSHEKSFIIPLNYTCNAIVKIHTDKTENNYNVDIACKDNNYGFTISDEVTSWNILYNEDKCVMSNGKFKENDIVIDNLKIRNMLMSEFDLSKFKFDDDNKRDKITYFDGIYKHVLTFSEENFLPNKIFVYKNNNLVKTIEYIEFKVEEL